MRVGDRSPPTRRRASSRSASTSDHRRGDRGDQVAAPDEVPALQRGQRQRRALVRRTAAVGPLVAAIAASSFGPVPGGSGSRRWRAKRSGADGLAAAEQRRGQLERLERGHQELGLRRELGRRAAGERDRLVGAAVHRARGPASSVAVAAGDRLLDQLERLAQVLARAARVAAASRRCRAPAGRAARRSAARRLGERARQVRHGAGGRARALRGPRRLLEHVDDPRLARAGACTSWVATAPGPAAARSRSSRRRARARASARARGCPRRRPRGSADARTPSPPGRRTPRRRPARRRPPPRRRRPGRRARPRAAARRRRRARRSRAPPPPRRGSAGRSARARRATRRAARCVDRRDVGRVGRDALGAQRLGQLDQQQRVAAGRVVAGAREHLVPADRARRWRARSAAAGCRVTASGSRAISPIRCAWACRSNGRTPQTTVTRQPVEPADEVAEPAQRRLVAPLQIVDQQQQRRLLGELDRQPVERVQDRERRVLAARRRSRARRRPRAPPPRRPPAAARRPPPRTAGVRPRTPAPARARRRARRTRARPRRAACAAGLGEQPRLADPGRPFDHQQPRVALRRRGQRAPAGPTARRRARAARANPRVHVSGAPRCDRGCAWPIVPGTDG